MRIFASDRVKGFMQKLGMQRGEAIEHRMVSNAIEKAQRKVEGRNFDIRKQLLEYDDVANDQRRVIYQQRNELLASADVSDTIAQIRADVVNGVVSGSSAAEPRRTVERERARAAPARRVRTGAAHRALDRGGVGAGEQRLRERVVEAVAANYAERVAPLGADVHKLERHIMLQVLDTLWKEHLSSMDALRQGIHLRAYASRNPKQEYKREAFKLFEELLEERQVRGGPLPLQGASAQRGRGRGTGTPAARGAGTRGAGGALRARRGARAGVREEAAVQTAQAAPPGPFVRDMPKVGRNEPCPCGSGKKYKAVPRADSLSG